MSGRAVADGADLRLLLVDHSEVRLARFYNPSPNAAPITVALDLVEESDCEDAEIQIEEDRQNQDLEQITFSYQAIDESGEAKTKTVTVEVNSSRNCPLQIEVDE